MNLINVKFIALFFILFFKTILLPAQTFVIYGDKAFGSSDTELSTRLRYMNNSFYLAGTSFGNISGDKTDYLCNNTNTDLWVLRLDTSLNILWDKSLGGASGEGSAYCISTPKNSIIVTGFSGSNINCEKSENSRGGGDYWICELDSNGTVLWDKTFGGSASEMAPKIARLSTGDLIISGTSQSPISGDKTVQNHGIGNDADFWTLKLDSTGNKIWERTYGGDGTENAINEFYNSIIAIEGDNFLLGGVTESDSSGDISQPSRGLRDIWILKCNSAGNKIWDKRLGGSDNDYLHSLLHTSDMGYIIAGSTRSPQDGDISQPPINSSNFNSDCWIIKLDSAGNKLWDKRFGGNDDDLAYVVKEDYSGFIIGGYTKSQAGFDVTDSSFGTHDYWVFKLDQNGNKIWDKRFGAYNSDYCHDLIIMSDSSIIAAGRGGNGISAVKTDSGKGDLDYWMIRFKYISSNVGLSSDVFLNNNFQLFPNPASDQLTIRINELGTPALTIEILDLVGRNIKTVNYRPYSSKNLLLDVDVSDLTPGTYLMRVQSEQVLTKKFVKL